MLMESIGDKFISNHLQNNYISHPDKYHDAYELESIHLSFMSQGNEKVSLHTNANEAIVDGKSSLIGLNTKARNKEGNVISDGILQYRAIRKEIQEESLEPSQVDSLN